MKFPNDYVGKATCGILPEKLRKAEKSERGREQEGRLKLFSDNRTKKKNGQLFVQNHHLTLTNRCILVTLTNFATTVIKVRL